ncbi:MAG: 5'-methylthioadenosine/S-adenosylhomocysteine nucleosidase [Sphingomonas sp.]|uniref:5'-methylthioadenosine/S-adenosylhomocysteine nucleosidase n=1 Tax=Sphingomonas sp. TaxID=28214 RepID=UPI002273827C|nr:5'-methylthioadenosine/S-adenosylhomocysteine nucleosidase [Sphingomonas sp.]MCX8475753.1 5'-methylthioadenosine/S-adenosylhomocysteine nucleosidase [Sphingomonas sp.]
MRYLLLILALLAMPVVAHADETSGKLDVQPRIAIISAFEPEWITLNAAIVDRREWTVNGVKFVGGTISGRPVLLFLSGVSMVNAAMTTQLALDKFQIRSIVFSGVAGGLDPALDVGDVVVPDRWGQYLESAFARAEGNGFAPPSRRAAGEDFANYGMIFPNGVRVRRTGDEQGATRRFWFEVDPGLLATARKMAPQVTLAKCSGQLCFRATPKVVVGGNGISGPVFMDNAEFRKYAFATFQAQVTDMETAAVGQVAYANGVPYIAFRSLSDLAGGDPGENQAPAFYRIAADNSARVVVAFIGVLEMPR